MSGAPPADRLLFPAVTNHFQPALALIQHNANGMQPKNRQNARTSLFYIHRRIIASRYQYSIKGLLFTSLFFLSIPRILFEFSLIFTTTILLNNNFSLDFFLHNYNHAPCRQRSCSQKSFLPPRSLFFFWLYHMCKHSPSMPSNSQLRYAAWVFGKDMGSGVKQVLMEIQSKKV